MRKIAIMILLAVCGLTAYSQRSLELIASSLDNKDVYVAPIIRGVRIIAQPPVQTKDSIRISPRYFVVSSLDEDIRDVASMFSTDVVSNTLYLLLQDSTRDFYANALLYDLLDNKLLCNFFGMTREEWIESGRQRIDRKKWDEYIGKEVFNF